MPTDAALGANISYYRNLSKMTQAELARAVGVSPQAVSKWEQQLSCPDILLLPRLSQVLGVSIDALFGKAQEKEIVYSLVGNVPWYDDGKLRFAVYSGRKLLIQNQYTCTEGENIIRLQFDGHGGNYMLRGVCNLSCTIENSEIK